MIIKITPGVDPYAQLDLEEDELEYKVGDETASEIHPDDDDADDLSCITIDSMKHIDNDKVKEIWAGMAKIKHQEGEYYEQLAGMVDEMTPEVVYQSVQATHDLLPTYLHVQMSYYKNLGVRNCLKEYWL